MVIDLNLRRLVLNLLESYNDIRSNIEILQYELRHSTGVSADELIGQMALPGRKGDSEAHPLGISDRTMYIALNYQERLDQIRREDIEDKLDRLTSMVEELDRLEMYVGHLKAPQAEIIRRYYFQRLSWKGLEKAEHITIKGLQKRRDEAVCKLASFYELSGRPPQVGEK